MKISALKLCQGNKYIVLFFDFVLSFLFSNPYIPAAAGQKWRSKLIKFRCFEKTTKSLKNSNLLSNAKRKREIF